VPFRGAVLYTLGSRNDLCLSSVFMTVTWNKQKTNKQKEKKNTGDCICYWTNTDRHIYKGKIWPLLPQV